MRDGFPFLGIMENERVHLTREALAGLPSPSQKDLAAVATGCWKLDEREYQYAGVWHLRRHATALGPGFIGDAERLVVTKSWWDTVPADSSRTVAALGGYRLLHPQGDRVGAP